MKIDFGTLVTDYKKIQPRPNTQSKWWIYNIPSKRTFINTYGI